MTGDGLLVVLDVGRTLDYLGCVLFCGVLLCWVLGLTVSGPGRLLIRLRHLGLIIVGTGAVLDLVAAAGLIAISPLASPGVGADVAVDLVGGGALARLAVVVGTMFGLPDLIGARPSPTRRVLALLIVGVFALTLITSAPVIRRQHWVLITWAASWQLIGLAALVGASVMLIVLARPSRTGDDAVALRRARVVIGFGSVVVGTAAVATLIIDLTTSTGTDPGWTVTKIIGLTLMIALLLIGSRTRPSARASSSVRTGIVPGLLGAGLAVGAIVMIISSWLPDRLV